MGIVTHGYFGTRIYRTWQGMKNRATNKLDPQTADNYVNRGIDIDPRWLKFENFLADMGEPPSPELTLERIDNNKGYWPKNCRWATYTEQARNMRSNKLITYKGETKCLAEWAEILGIRSSTLGKRLRSGWSIEKAFNQPLRNWNKRNTG